jgi:hypothetical protein
VAAGTVDTLRTSESVPDSRKKRAVVADHKHSRKNLRTVGEKIRMLKREGKSQEQSVAIARSMQRRGELRK